MSGHAGGVPADHTVDSGGVVPARAEHTPGGGHHRIGRDAVEALGHAVAAAHGRQPDEAARAARQVDAQHFMGTAAGPVAARIGWPEERDDGRADRRGQVHRAGVAGDEHDQPLENRRQRDEVHRSRQIEHRHVAKPACDRVDERAIARTAGEHDRRAMATRERARSVCEASSSDGLMPCTTPSSTRKAIGVKARSCANATPARP